MRIAMMITTKIVMKTASLASITMTANIGRNANSADSSKNMIAMIAMTAATMMTTILRNSQ